MALKREDTQYVHVHTVALLGSGMGGVKQGKYFLGSIIEQSMQNEGYPW